MLEVEVELIRKLLMLEEEVEERRFEGREDGVRLGRNALGFMAERVDKSEI